MVVSKCKTFLPHLASLQMVAPYKTAHMAFTESQPCLDVIADSPAKADTSHEYW